jgi:hypothetical protein
MWKQLDGDSQTHQRKTDRLTPHLCQKQTPLAPTTAAFALLATGVARRNFSFFFLGIVRKVYSCSQA